MLLRLGVHVARADSDERRAAVADLFAFFVELLAELSFFASFFFLAVFGCWLTSSVIPQRSSKDSCTPSKYFGRGSISGFSSVGCGFSVGVSTACIEDVVSIFMAVRSTSF